MKKRLYYIPILIVCICGYSACNNSPKSVNVSGELPPIYPDYTNITIPYNIAPLNFLLRNEPEAIRVSIKGK
ncbi:hypothetical protein EZS27_018587, partial [termite gut metagenome]